LHQKFFKSLNFFINLIEYEKLILILAKRLTDQQKEEITKLFISCINLEEISRRFNCTKLTISRNLKNNLGEATYKELLAVNKSKKSMKKNKQKINHSDKIQNKKTQLDHLNSTSNENIEGESIRLSEFIEITPLDFDIENTLQQDFSSIPICDIVLPKTVFMIVDKKVELEIKYLKDYPKWQFLSEEELKRKSIEIFHDLKIAKSFCSKEQKVIKVPNTSIFKIVAPILISRGISRIVSSDKLIAL
tara:strand:+ start:75 stop:815 length:741 start_codon:yes stop_codon:yes gene_type:complete